MSTIDILILAGALAGGFVSGLTGFGTGITALPFWLLAVNPAIAAPLVVICSAIAQALTLPAIWKEVDLRALAPIIIAGLAGVPLGVLILPLVPVPMFKALVGALLVVFCSVMLFVPSGRRFATANPFRDGIIGLASGILGGIAGLSGVLPTLWARLQGLGRLRQRALFQMFNLTVLGFAALSQAIGGFVTGEVLKFVLIALPGTLIGAWAGRIAFGRVGDAGFDRIVLVVLMIAGVTLIFSNS